MPLTKLVPLSTKEFVQRKNMQLQTL